MSRFTRIRRFSKAVSEEVNQIWRAVGQGRALAWGRRAWFCCDPLESRIMLVAPTLGSLPALSTDEGKTIVFNASFYDADGPSTGCPVGYSATICWGDGTCSTTSACGCSCCGGVSISWYYTNCGSCCGPACGSISASHVYADNRANNQAYSATLQLSEVATAAPFSVGIYDVPPNLSMGGAATVAEGSSYTLTLSHSDPGASADPLENWNINWGDSATTTPTLSTTSTTHTFAPGVGHLSIGVTNDYTDTTDIPGPYHAQTISLDTSFSPGSSGKLTSFLGRVQALTVDTDGSIYAAFGNGGTGIDKDFILARFSSTGGLDSTFGDFVSGTSGPHKGYRVIDSGSNASDYASSIAIVTVSDTKKVLVAGSRTASSGNNDFAILRFNASDGSLDTSFGNSSTPGKQFIDFNSGYDYAYGMAIQGNQIILAGSAATGAGSNDYDFAMARLNMDGAVDNSFGTSSNGKKTSNFFSSMSNSAYDIKIEPSTNYIVLGGTTSTSGSTGNDLAVARFTADGAVDTTFGPLNSGSTTVHQGWVTVDVRSTDDSGRSVVIQDDGKIIVGGSSVSTTAGDLTDFAMARFNDDGTLDDGSSNDSTPNDRFGSGGSPPTPGTVMTNFDFGSDEIMRSVLQIDGRLVAVGYATTGNGLDFAIARYMLDGSLDTSFGQSGKLTTDFSSGSNDTAYAVALQSDGKILAGGIAGTSSAMARYKPLSTLDVWVIPNAPSGLTLASIDSSNAELSWHDNSQVETGFVIQKSSDGTTWADYAQVGANVTTYRVADLADAATFHYRVLALNGAYRSSPSSEATGAAINPDYAEVGQVVHLHAPAGGTSAVYTWNVSKNDQQFAQGMGTAFDFTPDVAGTYYVVMFTQDGSTTTSSTQTITVKDTAPHDVKIVGPAAWPLERVAVFSAVAKSVGRNVESLHYQWSVQTWVTDPDLPGYYAPVSLPDNSITDLPTFRFIPDQDDNTQNWGTVQYQITLVVSNDEGQSVTATRQFKGVSTTQAFLTGAADFGGLGTGVSAAPMAIAVQPDDGKVVEAGYVGFFDSGSVYHVGFALARFNPGTVDSNPTLGMALDTTFGGGDGVVITEFDNEAMPWGAAHQPSPEALAIAPDGRIIVVGEVATGTSPNIHSAVAIVAYNADGSLDTTFGPISSGSVHTGIIIDDFGGIAGARSVAIQSDGKIVVGGWLHENDDTEELDLPFVKQVFVARYNANGSPDDGSVADSDSSDHFGASDGRLIATVSAHNFDYNSLGGPDYQPASNISALAIQPGDGSIVAVGWANPSGQEDTGATWHDFLVMRILENGTLDEDFGTSNGIITTDLGHQHPGGAKLADFATSVVIQPDHKILVGGWTGMMGSNNIGGDDLAMVRYNVDGSLDESFGLESGTSHTGKLVDNPTGDYPITLDSGGYPTSADPNDRIVGLALQEDGKIVVAVAKASKLPENGSGYLARYNSDGSRDNTFDLHTGTGGEVPGNRTNYLFEPQLVGIALGVDGIYVAHKNSSAYDSFSLTRYMTRDAAAAALTATARTNGSIDLRWQDSGGGEDGFGIERWDPGSQSFVDIGYVNADVTTYTDANLLPGNTYRYRVYAFAGDSTASTPTLLRKGQSNEASATTAFPNDSHYVLQETLRVPVDGTHVQSISKLLQNGSYFLQASGYFDLSPTDDPGGAKHADAEYGIFKPMPYDIKPWYWNVNYGIAVADLGLTDHHDRGLYWGPLADDPKHTYRIGYTGNGGKLELWYRDDLYGDNQTISDGHGGTKPYEMLVDVYRFLPQAPSHLTATPDPMTGHISLKWQSNTPNAMYFHIQRSDNGGSWTDISTKIDPDSPSFTDTGVSANHRYTYRVLAHTATDDSPYSNEAVTVILADRPLAFDTIPAQSVATGKEFVYRVHALDPDKPWQKIYYSLVSSTTSGGNLSVTPAGYIDWETAGSPGTYTINVGASNDPNSLNQVTTSVSLTVTSVGSGGPSLGTPTATFDSTAGNIVHLTASASENSSSDGITYTWATAVAPEGAKYPVFSASNGASDATSLTATFSSGSITGGYVFLVTATDAAGRTDYRYVSVTVEPIVTSIHVVPRNAHLPQDADFQFSAVVKDQFGQIIADPALKWKIDGGDEEDGDDSQIIHTGTDAGSHTLQVRDLNGVSDAVQFVNSGLENQWPVIQSARARPDVNSSAILLTADAIDDFLSSSALTYTWSKVSGPGTVTFDPSTGIGKTIPVSFSVSGTYVFRVTVTDGATHTVGTAPTFDVTVNSDRVLSSLKLSSSAENVAPGASHVTISASGLDQYGDAITGFDPATVTWALYGVGSAVPDGTNQYLWTPPTSDEGIATVTGTVGSVIGTVSLKAVAAAKPIVHIISPMLEQRKTVFTSGLPSVSNAPVVDPATIDKDTDVYISVDDPNIDPGDDDSGITWTLTAIPSDGGAPIFLADNTTAVKHEVGVDITSGEKVATIHPLLLPQGLYTLKLIANDGNSGDPSSDSTQFVVKTPLKLGNLSLPVTDLTVQGNGLPITISRIYDSSQTDKYDAKKDVNYTETSIGPWGDFGPGWRLELPDADMQVTAMDRPGNQHGDSSFPTFMPGDAVYFTLPGGDVEGFVFDPQPLGTITNIDLKYSYKPVFKALGDSNSRLTLDPEDIPTLIPDPLTGEMFDHLTGLGYNPARPQFGGVYYLTTHDGTKYTINAANGYVSTVTDGNGNTLEYDLNGNGRLSQIKSYNGSSSQTTVTFNRNDECRIGSITDDATCHSIIFTYNPLFTDSSSIHHPGELASVTDRVGNTTQYGYDDQTSPTLRYHLNQVTDPRGLVVLTAKFDPATGEMLSLSDPYKKTAGMGDTSFAGKDARKSVTDLAGNKTEMVYDYRGRVTRQITEIKTNGVLSGYRVNITAYDDAVGDDQEIGGLKSVIVYQPIMLTLAQADQRHDVVPSVILSETDYDALGNVISQTDAAGRTTTLSGYTPPTNPDDPIGALESRPTLTGDAYGNHTSFTYDDDTGNLLQTTNSASETTLYKYGDSHGNVTEVSLDRGDPGPDTTGDHDDVPTSKSEYNGPDGQISKSQSDFRWNGSDWIAMSERDYDYTPLTIGPNTYRQEKVTLKWRDAVTDSTYMHTLLESITLYDADDRTWKVTDANGQVTETQYDSLGKVALTIDPFGGHTTYTYDARGQLIRTVYPDHTETRTAYDDMGRVTWQSDRYAVPDTGEIDNITAALATRSVYDDQGRLVQTRRYSNVLFTIADDTTLGSTPTDPIQRCDASGGALLSKTSTTYDSAGRASSTTDAAGVTSLTTYYDDGRTKNTSQGASGLPIDHGTDYAYDYTDSGVLHRQDRVTDALGHETITDYDSLGQAVKVTYDATVSDPSFSETLYGTQSTAVSRSDLPALPSDFPSTFEGQHVVKIAQHKTSDTEPPAITHYLYNSAGQLTDVWQRLHSDAGSGSDSWPHWQYTYDSMGNLASITDPNLNVTSFADTFAGSNDSPYQPGEKITHTRTLPAVGGSTVVETTRFDVLGRTLSVTDFKGQTTAYAYDDSALGQGRVLAEYRFANGVTAINTTTNAINISSAAERTEYSYDPLGRQSQIREYASGTGTTTTRVTSYAYDAITGAVSLIDSPEGKVHYEYDPATGRMTRTWTGADAVHISSDTLYGYDPLGRLKSVSSAKINGGTPTAPHVQLNRFNATGTAISNTLPTTTYDYDAVGNLKDVNLPSGNIEDYVYDHLNRLTTETIKRPDNTSHPIEETYDYTLQSNGQREQVIETRYASDGSVFGTTKVGWTYDTLGRLTSETRDVGNNGQDGEDYIASFSYDAVGNRLEKVFNSANNSHAETIDYLYDNRDRLSSEDSNVSGNDVCYSYDANGSMIGMTKNSVTTGYLWDKRNRLSGVDANNDGDAADSGDTQYSYDADGVRVKKVSSTGTSIYLNDPNNPSDYSKVLEEKDNTGAVSITYVLGHDVLSQAKAADTPTFALRYLIKDGHGTSRMLTVANSGSIAERYEFQAFGEPVDGFNPDTAATTMFFSDGVRDKETGFEYQLARYRRGFEFISPDDTGYGNTEEPTTLHKYLYTPNDPINFDDVNGHQFEMIAPILSWAADAFKFAIDPNRNFEASWGFGRDLASSIDFDTSDPFALASIVALPSQLQLMDIFEEVRRGTDAVSYSSQLTWQAINATWELSETILIDLIASFAFARACFATGTPVVVGLNSDGSYHTKRIEDIREGDVVLARNELDQFADARLRRVEAVFSRKAESLRVLVVQNERGEQATIQTTDGHLIWVVGRGWTKAKRLEVNDRLCDARGDSVVVVSIRCENTISSVDVYTFRVADDHTYFVSDAVGIGRITVWVHNVCSGAEGLEEALREEEELSLDEGRSSKLAVEEALESGVLREVSPAEAGLGGVGGRLGNAMTRDQDLAIAVSAQKRGWTLVSGGGGPQRLIPGAGGGARGGAYADIVLTKNGRILRINTVDTLADGITPTAREQTNASRIRALRPKDHLLLVPKAK